MRHLTFYCNSCLDEDYKHCSNEAFVENWRVAYVQPQGMTERRITRSEVIEEHDDPKQLVCKDSIIAIAAADRGEDYYLLKVTSEGEELLQRSERDGFMQRYCKGSSIFRGNFFNRLSDNILHFTIDLTKQAIVLSETVRYLCPELEEFYDKDEDLTVFRITEQEHLDILDCLNPI